MMKALREIGWRRALKFVLVTCAHAVYDMALFPPVRAAMLMLFGARIGRNAVVHRVRFFNMDRTGFRGLRIGESCFLGDECLIDLADAVTMEAETTLAERVTILTHTNVGYRNHPLQAFLPSMTAPVVLRRGAFVGANATLLPGVEIGECAVVAVGAVVREHVPPFAMVAGVPATIRKYLRDPSTAVEASSDKR